MSQSALHCPICDIELKPRIYEMRRIFVCPNCQRVFNKNLQVRFSRIEVVDLNLKEDMTIVKRISREFGHIVAQFLEKRTREEFNSFDVIPVIVGTNARALFSPRSDIDVWVITSDDLFGKIEPKARRLYNRFAKDSLTCRRLDLTNRPYFPREVLKQKIAEKIDVNCMSLYKILNMLESGHNDPRAEPFQTPQQVILSASVSAILSRDYEKRLKQLLDKLTGRYRELSEKQDTQMERLFAGLYAYDIIGHLCFGLRRSEFKALLNKSLFPSDLRAVLEGLEKADFPAEKPPLFKSVAYREWEFLQGRKTRIEALQDISKTLYRCMCDFLPSMRIYLKGSIDDLRSETFVIADKFFSEDERKLLYETQALRLGKYISISSKEIQLLAQEIMNIMLKEILDFELCPEILKAQQMVLRAIQKKVDYTKPFEET